MSTHYPHRIEIKNSSTEIVVFIMGIRILSPFHIFARRFVRRSMNSILSELQISNPTGYLAHEYASGRSSLFISYWSEYDNLLDYARNKSAKHFPAWYEFNSRVSDMNAIGLWHEIYQLPANSYKGVYKNCPPSGMSKFLMSD